MVSAIVQCPSCQSAQIYRHGRNPVGIGFAAVIVIVSFCLPTGQDYDSPVPAWIDAS
ncbi:hypothetical protein CRI69_16570 [Escherichia sp. E4742]|nr:hypothetical protein CRI69_16570 [Escherichia sp. E4742]